MMVTFVPSKNDCLFGPARQQVKKKWRFLRSSAMYTGAMCDVQSGLFPGTHKNRCCHCHPAPPKDAIWTPIKIFWPNSSNRAATGQVLRTDHRVSVMYGPRVRIH